MCDSTLKLLNVYVNQKKNYLFVFQHDEGLKYERKIVTNMAMDLNAKGRSSQTLRRFSIREETHIEHYEDFKYRRKFVTNIRMALNSRGRSLRTLQRI